MKAVAAFQEAQTKGKAIVLITDEVRLIPFICTEERGVGSTNSTSVSASRDRALHYDVPEHTRSTNQDTRHTYNL
jgi:hypothetical protein